MYNKLKNMINTYFFNNFVQDSYDKVSETSNVEEVYYQKNKLAIVVKDEELGLRVYDIVKSLKDNNETILTPNSSFKIHKYISDEDNRVQIFYVDFTFKENWHNFSELQKLCELASFVDNMQNKGYILDSSKFDNEKCNCISNLLSFFTLNNGETEISNEALIKYIHYILSNGGDLDEFYQGVIDKGICKISDFPYSLPVIKMCYEFFTARTFSSGTFERNIYEILDDEYLEKLLDNGSYNYIMFNQGNFEANSKLIADNGEYSVYDGNIKIYHEMSYEFENFIKDNPYNEHRLEQIDELIVGLDEKIIGYKFSVQECNHTSPVTQRSFKSQQEVFNFIFSLNMYIRRINKLSDRNEKNNFNIEDSLVFMEDSNSFQINQINQLFDLISCDENILKNQVTSVFFKLYLKYLSENYGKMHDEEEFFDNFEVRYLSPILTREFINYALGKEVNYEAATNEFFEFLHNTKTSTGLYTSNKISDARTSFYDSRFEYNPIDVPFIFDYEAESEYGVELKNGMREVLSDGSTLVTFSKKSKISTIKKQEDNSKSLISTEFLSHYSHHLPFENDHVKLIGVSKIICCKTINNDGMYDIVGYITTPFKGKVLTDDVLASLNNRDFIRVVGYLFSKFDYFDIPRTQIFMDDNFVFYINILDENFTAKNTFDSFRGYTRNVIQHLIKEKKCNPNNFLELEGVAFYKHSLIELADTLNNYCDEHKIYFAGRKKMCPICLKTKYPISQKILKDSKKLFEDEYAIHYSIDNNYNVKVYKEACVDMAWMEKNIDDIIAKSNSNSQFYEKANLHQDCFVPYKKALMNNRQFVGYVYEAVEFQGEDNDNICINLGDLEKLTNLPRIMSLIRLILQVKQISNAGLGFIKNPFDNVFLIKSHKKQVQVLNIDFLSKEGNVKDTMNWTYEYVCKILASDKLIDIDISNCSGNLDKLLIKLQELSKKLTKYCSYHKMYYEGHNLFCPKCVDKSQIKDIEIEVVDVSKITSLQEFNQGGEAIIYHYDNNMVAKRFKETEVNFEFKNRIIARLMSKRKILEEINKDNSLKYKYIIPKKLFVDFRTDNIFAYLMDKVNGNPISILRDKVEVEKLGLSEKDVFEILITVGEGIETLHKKANIYIGDLNGRNILFDTNKNVYFLDFDGMGIDNIAPEFCTDGYIDPVSKKNHNITMKDDWYSFAIQAFHYLTFTHPFNGIYSVQEHEKVVVLDIPEKMERRISLLGQHGMKPPAIAKPWDWMDKELKRAFLNIFERNIRESIVPQLIRQYKKLYAEDNSSTTSKTLGTSSRPININLKFAATNVNPFNANVVRVINHYSAICNDGHGDYISIIGKKNSWNSVSSMSLECNGIKNILLSEDENLAFILYEYNVIVLDLSRNTKIHEQKTLTTKNVVVNDRTLYFTNLSRNGHIIFKIEFMPDGEVKKEEIKFLTNLQTKRLYVKFNSKFVVVKHNSDNVCDEVYCNSIKLCDMAFASSYNIVYDEITKLWLVINSEGNGIVINSKNGSYEEFSIGNRIDDFNIENITFNKGNIYIPSQESLYIISTNNQFNIKKMECRKIMTPDSRLYDINTDGFSVLTENNLYEVRKR